MEHVQQIIGWAILGSRTVWHTLWWHPTTTLTHKSELHWTHLSALSIFSAVENPTRKTASCWTLFRCLPSDRQRKRNGFVGWTPSFFKIGEGTPARSESMKVPQLSFMGCCFNHPHPLAHHFLILQVCPWCWACHAHHANLSQPRQPCFSRSQILIWLPGSFLCVGSCIISHRPSCDARKTCLYATLILTHPQLLVNRFDSLLHEPSRGDLAAFCYSIDGCADLDDLGGLERDSHATLKPWQSRLGPLGRNWMWNFEPCQVDSEMQLLDNMLIHVVSFCFSLQHISLSLLDVASLWSGSPVGYKLPNMCHWATTLGWQNLVHGQPAKDRAT